MANRLTSFPEILIELRQLEQLNIANNEMMPEPNTILHLNQLTELVIDADSISPETVKAFEDMNPDAILVLL